jgi:hypothetical protein
VRFYLDGNNWRPPVNNPSEICSNAFLLLLPATIRSTLRGFVIGVFSFLSNARLVPQSTTFHLYNQIFSTLDPKFPPASRTRLFQFQAQQFLPHSVRHFMTCLAQMSIDNILRSLINTNNFGRIVGKGPIPQSVGFTRTPDAPDADLSKLDGSISTLSSCVQVFFPGREEFQLLAGQTCCISHYGRTIEKILNGLQILIWCLFPLNLH